MQDPPVPTGFILNPKKEKSQNPSIAEGQLIHVRKRMAVLMLSYCHWPGGCFVCEQGCLLGSLTRGVLGRGSVGCIVNGQISPPVETVQRSDEAAVGYE